MYHVLAPFVLPEKKVEEDDDDDTMSNEDEVNQGVVEEPRLPKTYRGRGGKWACENCMKVTELPKGSFTWDCEGCEKKNFTHPLNECPLEKARRYFVRSKR
ncbi:expressed unknown protein [Seminavis robusta]|uniref:Uncharacterized protein n=1 Tax=Seminavis robusta TaxID=568900 RepID=A0A9N8DLY3_9STRA|nr:expressed unknown protein [Seminavis robusta]|eukprot:Sro217_g089820.1 n/a (101) ;mRNA; f:65917-66219